MIQTNQIVESARAVAESTESWADLSNVLFNPVDGLVARAYPTREERAAFIKTAEYRAIRGLVNDAIDRTGLVDGATPKKSGKFVARVPQSLHAALEKEAAREGVSLNQLVVTKLAMQLSDLADNGRSPVAPLIRAFLEVRDGYSTDRVVADPELNRRFLERARQLGAIGTDFQLNWTLFNARKAGSISVPTKTRRYTVPGKDEFEFATEMAISFIQRKLEREAGHSISLDKIICDPELAEQFDKTASLLAPGYRPLEYRWIVLGLRKARRFSKQAAEVDCPRFDSFGTAADIRAGKLPTGQGLYTIRTDRANIYIGETDNLRHRIEHHFESGGGKSLLPEWLFEARKNEVQLGILPLGTTVLHEYRKTLELGCIGRFQPPLNYINGQPRLPAPNLDD